MSTYTILSLKKASIRKSVTKCKTICNLKPKEEKEELKSLSKGSKNKVGAQIRKFSGLVDNLRASPTGQNSTQMKRLR
jgi:hypothetical protein